MKRVDIIYEGIWYSVSGRDYDDVKQEVIAGIANGETWMRVNHGEGAPTPADILLAPGIGITLLPVAGDDA
ncbi:MULTISPECIES: hypothetical protein [unclassified Leifsonia]|uniref:hypothetical protein n=1 Tax=unclassified Leifsonia TaxID=2663824 RepID=UPI0006F8919B|nr:MULTISPECIES: hypothetical protein [unclassified Leifsonia]KQX06908.1 hypothetical protein ASC59_03530 [Leifsonia sp. Root1293]KRA11193.1 hypothetical protein ASD61_03530 [Leifsonia sp. Root60]